MAICLSDGTIQQKDALHKVCIARPWGIALSCVNEFSDDATAEITAAGPRKEQWR